jgi:hypothetical protein
MKIKRTINFKYKLVAVLMLLSVSMAFTLMEGDGKKQSEKITFKAGDAYRLFINNIDMPMNRAGVIADANISGGQYGKIDGKVFLYSAGFFMSGVTNGVMWANAVASASRIQDYAPGTYESGRTDPRAQIYVVAARDGEFSPSWDEWRDAVALGAEFYDGDGDGVYNPVDKNQNGKWDADEDRPDLIGDETVWTVYHDAVNPALRRFNDVDPQGIEVRQTVFAFASKGVTGNMIFVRYSILNTGLVADVIDSVYFGVWADPDLGDAYDDLVGSDVPLNAGYVYNDGDDADFGVNPPCFMIDFFQGPVAYIPGETFTDVDGNGHYDEGVDVPLDTAYNVRGIVRGIEVFPGAKNLGLSSFVHYQQSDVKLGDPNNRFEARNYMLGRTRLAERQIVDTTKYEPNPCTWYLSNANFSGCETVNNLFWYSGDPVTGTGWINNTPTDQRQMSNTGPFALEKDKPVTIIAAYVVGRGTNALNSITEARTNDITAQIIFDANFPSPPPPPPVSYNIKTGESFIDITIETAPQLQYRAIDTVLDIDKRIQGFYMTAFRTNIKAGVINGIDNRKDLVYYNLRDSIEAIYRVSGNGGQDLIIPAAPPENVFDSLTYVDPDEGRIKLRISQDPFTGGPLIKGKEYYFTITQYALNHNVVVNRATGTYGPAGDYLDPTGSGLEEIETQIIPVTFAKDLYSPAQLNGTGEQIAGASAGAVAFLPIDLDMLTGDDYAVEFFKDDAAPSTALYTPFWRLVNTTRNVTVLDSSKVFNFDTTNYAGKLYDGMIVKVKPTTTEIGAPSYSPNANVWYSRFSFEGGLGVWYVGGDVASSDNVLTGPVPNFGLTTARSNAISADRLRTVEIRFGVQGKAYRYLNGYIGNVATAPTSYRYAGGLYPGAPGITNPSVLNDIGLPGEGYVDVPFQVWVKDARYNEEKQLACGFIERRSTRNGIPDGVWDPDTSIVRTLEYIFVLDAPYDPNGAQIEYTGGVFGTDTVWADPLRGYTIPASFTGVTEKQRKVAASPWFNAMYVLGLQRSAPGEFYQSGDVFTIPLNQYPYTDLDRFTFSTKKGNLIADEKRALFDKVNVYPNPLYAHNPATSFNGGNPDEPFVTFSNLPEEINIKIYTLSGTLIRTLTTEDKATPTLPFLNWNLQNEDGLRVASGMYLAIVSSPEYGEKVLKFAVIMPQKQIQRF